MAENNINFNDRNINKSIFHKIKRLFNMATLMLIKY